MKSLSSRSLAAAAIGSTVLAMSLQSTTHAATTHAAHPAPRSTVNGSEGSHGSADFDSRAITGKAEARAQRSITNNRSPATTHYVDSLGNQAILDFDPLTKTPRLFATLNGYLTGPSTGSARTIALDYVKSHLAALGLAQADLGTFVFRKDYVDPSGLHNLSWEQEVDGTPVFGNGLQVKVTRDGRVLSVLGSPVSGLAAKAADAKTGDLTAAGARTDAAKNVDGRPAPVAVKSRDTGPDAHTTWANHDFAQKVWFLTPDGLRQGWSTYVQTGRDAAYQHVIDAATGKPLYRHSTVQNADGDAFVYDYYPGAASGGKAAKVNLVKKGWLAKGQSFLNGTSVITWDDVNDDNAINTGETTPVPNGSAAWKLTPFTSSTLCSPSFVCTWDEHTPFSWRTNRLPDAANGFYLASKYHDYLLNDPAIRFTPQAGSFDAKGGDPVLQQVYDGANTLNGLPDGSHVDNANMSTPPDGVPPTMQMYLWKSDDGFTPTSGAFDASVLLHEYTHGLSNRLVIDADGNSTLNSLQAGAMGEAWSDYYAMDYLVTNKFQADTAADGQVYEGQYLMGGQKDANGNPIPFRTEPMDCSVGSSSPRCVGQVNGKQGGYTYGDVPTIGGGAEVHSSGEVWAQTLWDIRKAFGHNVADTLITRAMSLSAADPSMLDMRNAIIQADLVAYSQNHTQRLWQIFANRGMGYFAGSVGSSDAQPAEDFHTLPPPQTPHDGTIAGFVKDDNGTPVEGATVTIGGFGSQYTTLTDSRGFYEFDNLFIGTYQKVAVTGSGFFGTSSPGTAVRIGEFGSGDFTNFTVQRDWAATSGGAQVTDFDGPDFSSFGCGPDQAFDTLLTTGWGSTTGDDAGDPTNVFVPKSIVVQLPQRVDVSSFQVDPTATCGDGLSASVAGFTIETSPDGQTWTTAAQGTFGVDNRGHLNEVDPTAGAIGVQYVRFTFTSNQTPDFATNCPNGAFSGCSFTDMTELAVFGAPAS